MNKRLQEKVAKAMYDCQYVGGAGDAPPWNEATDSVRDWLLMRSLSAIDAVTEDLDMFVTRNLTGDAADAAKMLIARLKG